jgi:hypothetical protein
MNCGKRGLIAMLTAGLRAGLLAVAVASHVLPGTARAAGSTVGEIVEDEIVVEGQRDECAKPHPANRTLGP